MKILIVDDEYYVREGMQAILQDLPEPKTLLTADNGLQALEICQAESIDILITDIRMPGMDGLEMAQTLRNLDIHPVVMIVSGFDDFAYAQSAIRLGVVDFLLKPIQPEDFLQKVSALCQRRRKDHAKAHQEAHAQALRYLKSESDDPGVLLRQFAGGALLLLRTQDDKSAFQTWASADFAKQLQPCVQRAAWLSPGGGTSISGWRKKRP